MIDFKMSKERQQLGLQVVSSVICTAALTDFKLLTQEELTKKCTGDTPDNILGEYQLIASFFTENERIEIISAVLSRDEEKIELVKTKYANRLANTEFL